MASDSLTVSPSACLRSRPRICASSAMDCASFSIDRLHFGRGARLGGRFGLPRPCRVGLPHALLVLLPQLVHLRRHIRRVLGRFYPGPSGRRSDLAPLHRLRGRFALGSHDARHALGRGTRPARYGPRQQR